MRLKKLLKCTSDPNTYFSVIVAQVFANMPESLRSKKKRLYDYLNRGIQNPANNPMLVWMLINNTFANKCRNPEEYFQDIHFLRERLSADERRIALLEAKVELLSHCLAKMIKMKGN